MSNTKIIIAGTSCTFVSAHSLADLNKVAKYKPAVLNKTDEDGNVLFFLMPASIGSIGSQGITYATTVADGEKACLTVGLPAPQAGKKISEVVAEVYGPIVAQANEIEAKIDEALKEIDKMVSDVESAITVSE